VLKNELALFVARVSKINSTFPKVGNDKVSCVMHCVARQDGPQNIQNGVNLPMANRSIGVAPIFQSKESWMCLYIPCVELFVYQDSVCELLVLSLLLQATTTIVVKERASKEAGQNQQGSLR